MKTLQTLGRLLRLILIANLLGIVGHAQAQNRIELDTLSWFGAGNGDGMAPGIYTKPGSPLETIVSTIPIGGGPKRFCNTVFGTTSNGVTMIAGSGGGASKGFFETLNDEGGTYTLTRTYLVTPGQATYMQVRMAAVPQTWLLPSSMSVSIDGRSLGTATRDNSNAANGNGQFLFGSQLWTPSSNLVSLVISVTMPGGCTSDEQILLIDQFYQEEEGTSIHAIDDTGASVNSNGGQSLSNVLANDFLGSQTPSLATVNLTQVSTTNPKVTLDLGSGAINVAPGTPVGTYQVVYQVCEKANPANCSQAAVTVPVTLAAATITVKKALSGGGRINPADQFTVQLQQYWDNKVAGSGTTKGSGATVDAGSGTTNPILVGTIDEDGAYYYVSEVMAAGSVSALSKYTTTVSCQNNGVGGADLSTVHALGDIVYAYTGDTIVCTITNSSPGAPTLSLKKALVGNRINDADQFTVQILQGGTVVNGTASSTTTGSGSLVTSGTGSTGVTTLSAGTSYTLNEVMAPGSASLASQYSGALSCSNTQSGGTSVPVAPGVAFTPKALDVISCTLTNTAKADNTVSGKVILDTGVGSGTAHDGLQNGAEPAQPGVTVSLTDCGSTVYSSSTSAGDGSFSLSLSGVTGAAQVCVVESVPPAFSAVSANVGTTAGSYSAATATLKFTPASGTAYSGIVLGNVPMSTLTSDGAQQTSPGQTVVYAHTYVAGTAGTVIFSTADTPSPAGLIWTSILYLDPSCHGVLDGTATLLPGPVSVSAGQQVCVLNKVTTPAGAANGVRNVTVLSATEAWSILAPPGTQGPVRKNTDITSVGAGGLVLVKEVRKTTSCPPDASASLSNRTAYGVSGSAKPGDLLEYRLRYSNSTAAPISAIVLHDQVPFYTVFQSALCLTTPAVGNGGCAVSQQPAVNANSGGIAWTLIDASSAPVGLQPLGSGSVSFCVQVQQ